MEEKEIKKTEEKKAGEKKKPKKPEKPEKKEAEHIRFESIVRILATDIPGNSTIYHGLTLIRGISWAMSNAICYTLKLDKNRKVSTLSEDEITKISSFIKNPNLPEWMLNRKRDSITGSSKHLVTIELDLQKEFDVRKMKKIKTYKGWRHAIGQPVRGQRTRSHFRKGVAIGVIKVKQAPAKSEKGGKGKE